MTGQEQAAPRISVEAFQRISDERLPFARMAGLRVEDIAADKVVARAAYGENSLRPGGTIAGPIMMGLADFALYALVLSRVGPIELAVTTQLSINFLRRPEPGDLMAEATALKVGHRLVVGEVAIWSARSAREQLVAQATGTYSVPPERA